MPDKDLNDLSPYELLRRAYEDIAKEREAQEVDKAVDKPVILPKDADTEPDTPLSLLKKGYTTRE